MSNREKLRRILVDMDMKLILVDDESPIRGLWEAHFKKRYSFGDNVFIFGSAEEAMEFLEKNDYFEGNFIVVSDHLMGGQNGLVFCSDLREKCPSALFVLISATQGNGVNGSEHLLPNIFLKKPSSLDKLDEAIINSFDLISDAA